MISVCSVGASKEASYMTLVLSQSKVHYRICFCNGSLMEKKKQPKFMPGSSMSSVGAFKGAVVILSYLTLVSFGFYSNF